MIECPTCGSTSWQQWITYSGTDLLELGWNEAGYTLEVTGRKYNEDGDGWECENHHAATDDQSERLDEARSEA